MNRAARTRLLLACGCWAGLALTIAQTAVAQTAVAQSAIAQTQTQTQLQEQVEPPAGPFAEEVAPVAVPVPVPPPRLGPVEDSGISIFAEPSISPSEDARLSPGTWSHPQVYSPSAAAAAVARNAAERDRQRRARIAARHWAGQTSGRPTVSVTPFTGRYGSTWGGDEQAPPIAAPPIAPPPVPVYTPFGYGPSAFPR